MSQSLDLIFASKGQAAVLRAMAQMKGAAKTASNEVRRENQEMAKDVRLVEAAYRATLTPMEVLQKKAAALTKAINNTRLPDDVRNKASAALKDTQVKMEALKESSGATKENMDGAFGTAALGKLKGIATGAGLVAAAMKLITNELRAQQDLADKAAATQVAIAAARNQVTRNLPGLSEEAKKQVLARLQKVAQKQGVSETVVMTAGSEAVSASGGDINAAIHATNVGTAFLGDQGSGAVSTHSGALLDLAVARKTKVAIDNHGFLVTVAGMSRPKDAKAQSQSIAPAVIGGVANGLTDIESGALFAAMTTGSGDTTGQESTTATINLATALEDFQGAKIANGDTLSLLNLNGRTTGEKLRMLQQRPEQAKAFLANLTGVGVKQKAFVEELLLGGPESAAQRQFAANLHELNRAQFRVVGQRSIDSLEAVNPLERRAAFNRGLNATVEQLRTRAAGELDRGEIELIREIAQRSGDTALEAKFRTIIGSLSDGNATVSIREVEPIIEASIARLQRDKPIGGNFVPGTAGVGAPGVIPQMRSASAKELEMAQILQNQLDLMREMRDEQRRTTKATIDSGGLVAE